MDVRNTGPLGVVIQYDAENSARAIVVSPQEAIKLRDLLLREFPVAAEPEWCAACGKSPCNCPASEPSEPDPDEVRGAVDAGNPYTTVAAAARAWLHSRAERHDVGCFNCNARPSYIRAFCENCVERSREQRPLSDAEQVYFAACRETEQRAAEREYKDRRERIATALFAGMLANRDRYATAVLAVSYADSLIAALDKEQP